ncbi:hypothetical protein PUN28_018860 [Cardiocondyla obscurior]|uniref:Uncharacterized protein n=1 Tax=Cardiocondyla obscurior TaxID=286306 RepID=A0AAW2EGB8_9HYME
MKLEAYRSRYITRVAAYSLTLRKFMECFPTKETVTINNNNNINLCLLGSAVRPLAFARLYFAGASGARETTSITSSFLALSKQLITRPLFSATLIPSRFVARICDNALSRFKGASRRCLYKYVSIASRS